MLASTVKAHQTITIPYRPRPLQARVHKERKRFSVLVTHRRFGKTVNAICEQLRRAVKYGMSKPNWRAGYVAPYLKQAKSIAWDYLKIFAGTIPGVRFNETELRCDLPNGARLRLYGADNPESLRGVYFDDLVLDEAADIPRSVWTLILRPTLADRQGWAIFTGTPKGMNNLLYDMVQQAQKYPEEWALFIFKASETGYLAAEELLSAKADLTDDEYSQEFECSFAAAVLGAYYSRVFDQLEQKGRIGVVPYESGLPVHTAWDLGIDDHMSIWFFQVEPGGDWRVFDHYTNSGEGLDHYAHVLLHEKKYRYGRHIGPHDIMVRELGTGKSRYEVARQQGITFTVCRNIPVIDGITAVRKQLERCWFDALRCEEGVKSLRQYRKSYNMRMDVFGKPVHDWASHDADAFRYAVVGMMPERTTPYQEKTDNRSRNR